MHLALNLTRTKRILPACRSFSLAKKSALNTQLWGFRSQADIRTIISEQKIICQFMNKLQRSSTTETMKDFDLTKESLEFGLKVAYRRLAENFERGEPGAFEDLVEPKLARQLDYQLELFQKQKKVPRLNLQDVQVEIIGLWDFPIFRPDFQNAEGDNSYRDFYKSLPFFIRAQVYNLFLYLPGQHEVVLAVEFTTKQGLKLVSIETEDHQDDQTLPILPPPRKYVEEMDLMEQKVAEGQEQEVAEDEEKHYLVFVGQLDENQGNALEFKVRLMNEPFDFLLGM